MMSAIATTAGRFYRRQLDRMGALVSEPRRHAATGPERS